MPLDELLHRVPESAAVGVNLVLLFHVRPEVLQGVGFDVLHVAGRLLGDPGSALWFGYLDLISLIHSLAGLLPPQTTISRWLLSFSFLRASTCFLKVSTVWPLVWRLLPRLHEALRACNRGEHLTKNEVNLNPL